MVIKDLPLIFYSGYEILRFDNRIITGQNFLNDITGEKTIWMNMKHAPFRYLCAKLS